MPPNPLPSAIGLLILKKMSNQGVRALRCRNCALNTVLLPVYYSVRQDDECLASLLAFSSIHSTDITGLQQRALRRFGHHTAATSAAASARPSRLGLTRAFSTLQRRFSFFRDDVISCNSSVSASKCATMRCPDPLAVSSKGNCSSRCAPLPHALLAQAGIHHRPRVSGRSVSRVK